VSEEPLVCPGCARTYPRDERFCEDCSMPLVYVPGLKHQALADVVVISFRLRTLFEKRAVKRWEAGIDYSSWLSRCMHVDGRDPPQGRVLQGLS